MLATAGGSGQNEAAWRTAVEAAATHPLINNPTAAVSKEYFDRLAGLRFR